MRIRFSCYNDFILSDGTIACREGNTYELRKEQEDRLWTLYSLNPFEDDSIILRNVSLDVLRQTNCFDEELPF